MAAQSPRPKSPPLTALRAFEAAGRLGGFTPAARELGVTPAAVTAHLKTLEGALGVQLFDRRHKGVALTELGARVLPDFTHAFRQLDAAVQHLRREAIPGLVRIATTADLAQLWLSPRLPGLRAQGLQVVPVPVSGPEEARNLADLALFPAPGPGHPAPLVAVAAPGFAPASLAALDPDRTLVLDGPLGDWSLWATAAGLSDFQPRGPVHGSAALALEEAANGAGVLVIARPLAEAALRQGRVTTLFGVEAASPFSLTLTPLREAGDAAARVLAALSGR
ncbi:LysR family transcriptional regulator [Rhodobacter sp. NTK016B]|uniref:LysR family transcriptional regulator n=1 Tax=Rhodobacter sp. NTK016B TaxID=2759676 RepID=UPI001A8E4A8C|nr:LysR family transcriptional regulator [Rhodobacter sp. NTK016B]MBN8290861.1 LysR family transcriptional regulator [Rhodobacter sp. NTK016B]